MRKNSLISSTINGLVDPTSTTPTLSAKDFVPSEEYVKQIGRTCLLDDTLWLAYSATGIEFTFTGTQVDITLKGDNIAISEVAEDSFCRYGIYVNESLFTEGLLKVAKKTIPIFKSDTQETVTIKVLKLSESAMSTMGICKINAVTKEVLHPTKAKAHKIEIIGDSITCGFGVDDHIESNPFSTATEDATKAYAYKTAQALEVDYSLVSFSGYGIISGYTGDGVLNSSELLPPYYEKLGFSRGYFNGDIEVASVHWDFNRFVPELVVINLGTNDASYCLDDTGRQASYAKEYVEFLKQVRRSNPKATLLSTLGIMGASLYPSLEAAVSKYKEETGDTKVSTLKFDEQQEIDGFGACWHPSEITQTKAADKLTTEIKAIMGW